MTEELFRLLGLIAVITVFSVMLNGIRPEYSILLVMAASITVVIAIFACFDPILGRLKELFESLGNAGDYFIVALKALGISYITGFVADTCRDFGHSSLASKAELAGKCTIFALSLPMLVSILETAVKFAEL